MRKRISLKTRRPDLTPREFRLHYEDRHVPLGLGFIDEFRWRRYIRNHVRRVTGTPVSFDCYAEFWVDDDFDDASLDRFIRSAAFRVLNEDDERFLDTRKRVSFDLHEIAILDYQGEASIPTKASVVWKAGTDSVVDRERAARRIVEHLGERLVGASLDTAIGAAPSDAPFDTLLTLYLADTEPIDVDESFAPAEGWSCLDLDPIETPRESLYTNESRTDEGRREDRHQEEGKS